MKIQLYKSDATEEKLSKCQFNGKQNQTAALEWRRRRRDARRTGSKHEQNLWWSETLSHTPVPRRLTEKEDALQGSKPTTLQPRSPLH